MKTTTTLSGVYPSSGGYAHSVVIENPSRWLFTSGTMGLDDDWNAPLTVEEQLGLIWHNIRSILAENSFTVDDIIHLTCLLADSKHSKQNANAIKLALDGRNVPRTVFCAQLLDASWLAEIQVIAACSEKSDAD